MVISSSQSFYSGRGDEVTLALEPHAGQETTSSTEMILKIPIERIRPFSGQPREFFNENEMKGLVHNIKLLGQLQPGVVKELKPSIDGKEYELIDGERRLRACLLAGLLHFRAIVRNVASNDEQYALSAAANFNRSSHTDLETIRMVDKLIREFGWTQRKVAEILGKSMAWVSQRALIAKRVDANVLLLMDENVPRSQRLLFSNALQLLQVPREEQFEVGKHIAVMKLKEAAVYVATLVSGKNGSDHSESSSFDIESFESMMEDFSVQENLIPEYEALPFTSRKISNGEAVYRNRDPAEFVFVVESGLIELVTESLDHFEDVASERTTGLRGSGEVFGALFGTATYLEEARAVLPTTLRIYDPDRIPLELRMRTLQSQYLLQRDFASISALGTTRLRLIKLLLYIHSRYVASENGEVPLTQERLGRMIGVVRESVSKVLGELGSLGFVSTRGGVKLRNPEMFLKSD